MRAVFYDAGFYGLEKHFGHQWLNVVIDLNRSFSRPQVEDAASKTMETFPILGCRYVKGFIFDHWLPDASCSAQSIAGLENISVPLEDATTRFIHEEIDPEKGPPWRVRLLVHERGARLVIKVLHLAADGAGAMTIAREFGAFLFGCKDKASPASMNRGMWQVLRVVRLGDIPLLFLQIFGEFIRPLMLPFISPEPLPPVRNDDEFREQHREVVISGQDFRNLKDRCAKLNCTINDALVAALVEIIKESTSRKIIGVLFTVDLRKYLPEKKPIVANLSGGNILTLRRSRSTGFDQTAQVVAQRTGEIKKRVPGLPLVLWQLVAYGFLPHGIIRLATGLVSRYFASVMQRVMLLTNIGQMDGYLEPFGETAIAASIIGPNFKQLSAPVFVATGFRDSLTIQLCSWNDLPEEKIDHLAESLRAKLT